VGNQPAKTSFRRVSFNGESSVVKCTPFMGRKHQIRVHLKELGYPIVNDPLYNDTWKQLHGELIDDDEGKILSRR